MCAAGLSAIRVAGLIKHGRVWTSFKVSGADQLWNILLNGGSVYLLRGEKTLLFSHDILCVVQPDCHLHLHLRWADNPYVSGTVHTKDSAPGLIMGAGESPGQKKK